MNHATDLLLTGPPITMYNLHKAGETGRGYDEQTDDD